MNRSCIMDASAGSAARRPLVDPGIYRWRLLGARRPTQQLLERIPWPAESTTSSAAIPPTAVRNVPTYGRFATRMRIRGIDLIYYGNGRQLEARFRDCSECRPQQIRFEVKGANQTRVSDDGSLILATAGGASFSGSRCSIKSLKGSGASADTFSTMPITSAASGCRNTTARRL